MTTHPHVGSHPVSPARQLWRAVRDDLRERREAHAVQRDLEQQLATFRTQAEVNDLLGLLRDEEGAEADAMRDILVRNLRRPEHGGRLAS